MLTVSWFVCGMLYFLLYSYLFSELVCKEKFKINAKFLFLAIIMSSLQCLIMDFGFGYLRPYIMHLLSFIMLEILYQQKYIKTLLGMLSVIFITLIGELVFDAICICIFKITIVEFNASYFGFYVSNIMVFILSNLIFRIHFIKKFLNSIIEWYNKNEYKSLIIFVLFCLTIGTFVLYNNFLVLLPISFLALTNLFCVAVFVFVIGFFREKTNNNKIIYEYDQLMDYVKTYEVLLDEKSKKQHEYRNQLAVIRIMAKNKRTREYIDELLDEENIENNLETINKLKYIPTGGLKGLIYYKIETMKKKSINIFVDVSSELDNHKLWKECDKNLQDISKVLGVYLDNAIEAAELSKEKYITFEAYLDEKSIVFKISNTYENKIDVGKIDKEGYSTKGKGKGYGLALVKDIISKNNSLTQKREMNGIYYVQSLYIKK